MAKAKKLPSGNWRVRLYIGKDVAGKPQYKSFTAPTKKEAEAAAALYSVQKRQKDAIGMTVGEAIDRYIESKENVLSPSTIGGYRISRRNQLQGLMDVPLDEITNILVQAEINKEALRLSPKTLRNAHGLLSAALGVYMPDFTLRTSLPAKQHKIRELPTPEEVVTAIRGTDIELPVLLALWLSLRMSEVRGLRFSDISDGVLTVRNVRIKFGAEEFEKEKTKTYGSTRRLEVPAQIAALIGEGEPDAFIVDMPAQTITKKLRRYVERSCGKAVTFHQLRHLNASVMLQLGVPNKYAMERGGWSSDNVLKEVYQHTFSAARKEIDRRIDDYFTEIICDTKNDTNMKKAL